MRMENELTRAVKRLRSRAWADEDHLSMCSTRGAGPLAAQFTGRKAVHVTIKSPTYLSVAFLIVTVYSACHHFPRCQQPARARPFERLGRLQAVQAGSESAL